MARIGANVNEQVEAQQQQIQENVNNAGQGVVSGDVSQGIQQVGGGTQETGQVESYQPNYMVPEYSQPAATSGMGTQAESRRIGTPATVVSDVLATSAATMGQNQDNRQVPLEFAPAPGLTTPGAARATNAALQNASDLMRKADNQQRLANVELQQQQAQQPAAMQAQQQQQQPQTQPQQQQETQPAQTQTQATASEADEVKVYNQQQMEKRNAVRNEEDIMAGGISQKQPPKTPMGWLNKRFSDAKESLRSGVKSALSGRMKPGNAWRDVLLGDRNVAPNAVSVGSENLLEAIREPGSNIIDLVNENRETPLTVEECIRDIGLLVNAINESNIQVVLSKGPVNRRESIQTRTLRAHIGVGLRVHPTQLKAFNADFDGDEGDLLTDKRLVGKYNKAMSYLVDSEGKATIDLDFFPFDGIEDNRSQVIKSMIEVSFNWKGNEIAAGRAAEMLARDYIDCCNDLKNLKTNWPKLLRKIDKVAGELAGDRSENTSLILGSLYDFAVERRGLTLRSEWREYVEHSNFNPPPADVDPFVVVMVDYCDEIITGREAPSEQEFARMYNRYYGEGADKKNVPFRLLADFAKAVNRSEIVLLGSDVPLLKNGKIGDTIPFNQLYQATCSVAHSKRIADRVHTGSHELRASTELRNNVISEVGMPRDYASFRDFIDAFKISYNRNARLMNLSRSVFRSDMSVIQNVQYEGLTKMSHLGKPLLDIYGDKTMGEFFDVNWNDSKENINSQIPGGIGSLHPKYRGMTLSKFAMNNKMNYKIKEVGNHFGNGRWGVMDVIYLLADQRTAQTQKYREQWETMTEKFSGVMAGVRKAIKEQDWNSYMLKSLELLDLASPDMFTFFGMESIETFMNSEWGRRLINAKSVDAFRSTWVSMMIEYRMARTERILNERDEYLDNEFLSIDEKREVTDALNMAYENEMEILGSSSLAWDAVVKEEMQNNRVFKALIERGGFYFTKNSPTAWEREKKDWTANAANFWTSEEAKQYSSLVEFLKSEAPYQTKMNVLSDIVRLRNGYKNIMSFEMIGQLAYHPDRIHEGSQFDMNGGISSEKKAIKASIDRLDSFSKTSSEKAKKFADNLVKKAGKNKSAFESYIRQLATDPGFLVGVDINFAADAIASVIDKTYDDSEKIKQQEFVNGYFQALSYQRNGGFYTHLQQVDNKLLNKIGYDQLTPIDIIRVIGDPSIKMTVYDSFGNEDELSRASLCGGDSIDDVIKWINENPRMAYMFRRYVANIDEGMNKHGDDKTGNTVTINGVDSGFDLFLNGKTQSNTYKVFSLLNDRPRFLAFVSLVTPRGRMTQRATTPKITKSLEGVCDCFAYLANLGEDVNIEAEVRKIFNITPEGIVAATRVGKFDDGSGFDDGQGELMYSEVIKEIGECLDIIRDANATTGSFNWPRGVEWGVDPNSVVSYYDVRQQMSGARTSTMIGVEGSETVKNINLKIYLRNRKDRFIHISRATSEGELAKLSKITERDLVQEIEDSDEGYVILDRNMYEGLANWVPSDLTLSRGKTNQLTSTAKFFELKREKGAEEFNAKTKKFGDDGTNSITKFSKFTRESVSNADKLMSDLQDAFAAGGKDAMIPILAEALENADKDLGYIDKNTTFFRADYMNLADVMIAEDGTVRSLEQLSTACRNRLTDYAIAGGFKSQIAELEQIMQESGTQADTMFHNSVIADVIAGMRSLGSGGRFRGRRAARRHSSSFERNYVALSDIFDSFENSSDFNGERYVPPAREKMNGIVREAYGRAMKLGLSAYDKKRIEKLVMPGSSDGSGYGYDFIGVSNDVDMSLFPGPQSLVFFNERNDDLIERCKNFGITVAFSDFGMIPEEYAEDAMEGDGGLFIIPFFDMQVNGSTANRLGPAPAEFRMSPDNVTTCVEDTTYEVGPGDATVHIMKELADRVRINLSGDEVFDSDVLFPNVLRAFPNSDYQIDLCSREEVQKYIVNMWDDATIDIGIDQSHPDFYDEMAKMDVRIAEYAQRFDEADNASILTGEMKDDRIIGFAKIIIDGRIRAFAPIIPFHRNQNGKVPRSYQVDEFDIVKDNNTQFHLTWHYSGGIVGQAIKFFEGIGASNKMMTNGDLARSRSLQNGLPVDAMYSTKSVASRLFASNKRINTMVSLMMIPRVDPKYSYNFAEMVDAFPDEDPDDPNSITQRMLEGRMTLQDWINEYDSITRFHRDPEIDAVVRFMVRKCVKEYKTVNPSTLLATRTVDGLMVPMGTEFEAFMDTSLNFQNALMKLMNAMTSRDGYSPICPPSIDDNADNCLFKPVTTMGEDYGVLQMLVPHYLQDGTEYTIPENVYLHFGFFGDVFSGFGRLNLTASIHADDLNVANKVSNKDLIQLASLGRREMAAVDQMKLHGMTFDAESILMSHKEAQSEDV